MASFLPHLAPSKPVLHLAPPAGWMNDPNGLCFNNGLWHAFYQHDPNGDTHGPMHWGHATSGDLLSWEHHPIALHPDELGMIFSGSIVIDTDDTAGFGPGAMIAVFTLDLDARQYQSLAYSNDGGYRWQKFAGNPVLESDERDFRDPKVLRLADGWLMLLAVGHRIEFYRSPDLRKWHLVGAYDEELASPGFWECPDLVRLPGPGADWALTFSGSDIGPFGHGGTIYVPGDLRGHDFVPAGEPRLLDHGPDFYAMQSFHSAQDIDAVAMAWMSSWRHANVHPSVETRGVQSLPRFLRSAADGRLRAAPALAGNGESVSSTEWHSGPTGAALLQADGDFAMDLTGVDGSVATVAVADGVASVTRHQDLMPDYAQSYEAELRSSGTHRVVIDHGTLELFAADGAATISALTFAGPEWSISIAKGPAQIRVL